MLKKASSRNKADSEKHDGHVSLMKMYSASRILRTEFGKNVTDICVQLTVGRRIQSFPSLSIFGVKGDGSGVNPVLNMGFAKERLDRTCWSN